MFCVKSLRCFMFDIFDIVWDHPRWHYVIDVGHMKVIGVQAHYFHLLAFLSSQSWNEMSREVCFLVGEKFASSLTFGSVCQHCLAFVEL